LQAPPPRWGRQKAHTTNNQAENKIEQVLKSDATKLDLKEMRLTKMPESKQVQQMIHPTSCQKPNSSSPMARDQAYYEAEKKIE